MAVLTAPTFGATATPREAPVVFPPWQTDGIARMAATGFAIVDLHGGSHVMRAPPPLVGRLGYAPGMGGGAEAALLALIAGVVAVERRCVRQRLQKGGRNAVWKNC